MLEIAVIVPALFYFALGTLAILRPEQLLLGFGIQAKGVDARNEIRAVYGGFPLALSALLVSSLFSPGLTRGILLCASVATLGMAVGRLISALIDHRIGKFPILFALVEVLIAGLIAVPLVFTNF
jgi:uncharacterized membrane protein YjjP (DUF1212 family)